MSTRPRGVVAAGHPQTAEAGAGVLRAGGNAVDAAVAAMLASFVAEPALTGLGAGGYMLVHTPGGEQVLLDFFVEAPGRGLEGPRAELAPVDVSFGDAVPGLPHRRGLLRLLRQPGRRLRGGRALRDPAAERAGAARDRARARRRAGHRGAGLHPRDPRPDHRVHARVPGAARARGPRAAPGRAAAQPGPRRGAGAPGRRRRGAVLHGRYRDRGERLGDRARRDPRSRRSRRLRGRGPRAGARVLPRARRAHEPAALGGRHADRLRAVAARPPAAPAAA